MPQVTHKFTLQDHTYSYAELNRRLMTVGALSYIEDMHIYDYVASTNPAQEPGRIEIGRATSIGGGVTVNIYGQHDHHRITSSPLLPLVNSPAIMPIEEPHVIHIGHDVWIGNGVRILSNVKIGNGAVIGSGALVNKDIPPYAIAVGVPAKVIDYRFSPQQIAALEKIAWWNWSMDKIRDQAYLLLSHHIDDFIRAHLPEAEAAAQS